MTRAGARAGVTATTPEPQFDATVVIPTANRPGSLTRGLDALARQQTRRRFEVIVVDDGSDPAVDPRELPGLPHLRVIRAGGAGPGAARNIGIKEARARTIVFTDDDTEPDPFWLDAACESLDRHPEYVGVEGPVRSPRWDPLYEHSIDTSAPGAYLTCNIAYRRDALEQLDGFFENLPAPHCEDLDLAWRALELGEVGFDQGMTVVHHPSPLTLRRAFSRGLMTPSEAVLFSRHRSRFGAAQHLPPRVFPVVNALHRSLSALREEGRALIAPNRLLRFAAIQMAHLAAVAAGNGRGIFRGWRRSHEPPVKVLIVMPLAERLGGAEDILWSFLRHVDRDRVEPILVFFEDGPFRQEVAALGMTTHVVRPHTMPRPRIALFPPRLARIVRHERPDLIFSWLVEAQPFSGLASLLAAMPHRVAWWQANMPRADFVERLATALPSRAVFAYSHATADAQRHIWPHRRTIVVHPGIAPPRRADEEELSRLRHELGLPQDGTVIGIVGRLCEWKGQHHVLRALAILRSRGYEVHGLVVGGNAFNLEPEYEPFLRELAHDLGLDDVVTFTGQVPGGARYMQLMDVTVNASDPEPFGLVVLEAMALGTPVVAVNSGGPAEILDDGVSGLLVPSARPEHFAAALERLVESPELRRTLVDGGARRLEDRFTLQRMVEDLTAALERLDAEASGNRIKTA